MKINIKIVNIVGARPQFIKVKPIIDEFKKQKIRDILVHTGQHYNYEMSKIFFDELSIPKPDYNLEVGSATHGKQTGLMLERIEEILLKEKPNLVIVYGDTNSTLAGALAATKLHIPVAHIEAGLRSFDMKMPEEINRRLTDHISDYLFVTEPSGIRNLLNEGILKKKIYLVGNIMIDTIIKSRLKIQTSKILGKMHLKKNMYVFLTLHRPENVDKKEKILEAIDFLQKIQKKIKIIWPVHPRVEEQIKKYKFQRAIKKLENVLLIKPLGYLETINLIKNSKFVITDSGGIQEETTFLKIPCLTFRENTERPITVEIGTNTICKTEKILLKEVNKIVKGSYKKGQIPKLWDGKTAERIVKILLDNIC